MDGEEAERVTTLPRSASAWELVFDDMPVELPDGQRLEGFLVVVEARSGTMRTAGPVVEGGFAPLLLTAFTDPTPPCTPACPPRIVAADGESLRRAREALAGVDVVVAEGATPMADHFLGAFVETLSEIGTNLPPIPGLTVEIEALRHLLVELCSDASFAALAEDVVFRFQGHAALAGGSAILVGGDEDEGFVYFPPDATPIEALSANADDGIPQVTSWGVFLQPMSHTPADEQEQARMHGWILPGDRVPRAYGAHGAQTFALSEEQQRTVLAAGQALFALIRSIATPGMLLAEPQRGEADTVLGRIGVRSAPAEDDLPD